MKELTRKLRTNAVVVQSCADALDDAHSDEQIAELASDLEERARSISRIAQDLRAKAGN